MLQPLARAPFWTKAVATRKPAAATNSQAVRAARRGRAKREAPSCRGTRAKPRPIHAGKRNKKKEKVPWNVSSCRYGLRASTDRSGWAS